MKLVIDVREHLLIEQIGLITKINESIQISYKQLPIGDIILYSDDDSELVIIERKTVADLAASICDGRYKEQSFRLDKTDIPNHNIIYLIEGNIFATAFKTISQNTLYSALSSIMLYKGFSVIRSANISETCSILLNMSEKIIKNNNMPLYNKSHIDNTTTTTTTTTQDSTEYATVISSRTKKQNITPDNINIILLSQIPGVSVAIATAICSKFANLKALIHAIDNDTKCMDNIYLTSTNGKQRKISTTSVLNIKKYLSE